MHHTTPAYITTPLPYAPLPPLYTSLFFFSPVSLFTPPPPLEITSINPPRGPIIGRRCAHAPPLEAYLQSFPQQRRSGYQGCLLDHEHNAQVVKSPCTLVTATWRGWNVLSLLARKFTSARVSFLVIVATKQFFMLCTHARKWVSA